MRANEFLNEGILDVFRKKKVEPQYLPLTPEQRQLIQKHFPQSNVAMRMGGPESEYVLPQNVHTTHGKVRIAFRNEDGQLKASVAHHHSSRDAGDPKVVPTFHSDHGIDSDEDMEKLKQL